MKLQVYEIGQKPRNAIGYVLLVDGQLLFEQSSEIPYKDKLNDFLKSIGDKVDIDWSDVKQEGSTRIYQDGTQSVGRDEPEKFLMGVARLLLWNSPDEIGKKLYAQLAQ